MTRQQKLIFTLLVTLSGTLALQHASYCQDKMPSFYETVHDNFDKWDLDHDGKLSGDEILKAFESTKWKGTEAAAIAVLQKIETRHRHHKEPLESFSEARLQEMEQEAQEQKGKDKNQRTFESCLKIIQASSPELFPHGSPQLDGIKQGGANDCYFLSAVGGLAHARPDELERLIETNEKGGYAVHFHPAETIKVSTPTEGEISAYNSNPGDGLWLFVLQKAYGEHKLKVKPAPIPEDPMEAVVMTGGLTTPIIGLLTGHGQRAYIPKLSEGELRHLLSDAFESHRIVMVGAKGHVMAGIGYDPKSDQIEIWNPTGISSKYWGIKMNHGFFSMPISDFVDTCPNIGFEDPKLPAGTVIKHFDKHGNISEEGLKYTFPL